MFEAITEFDFTILNFIQEHFRCAFLDAVCGFLQPTAVIAAICVLTCVVLIFFKKTRRCGILALIALAISFLLGEYAIKHVVCRVRPCNLRPIADLAVKAPTSYSFPSGHAASAFSTAVMIFIHHHKWGILALALAVFVGLSRLYLYVHYPTDVLAGIALAIIVATLVWFVAGKIKPAHQLKKS